MEKATIYDYARMCNSYNGCNRCQLYHRNNKMNIECDDFITENPDKANEIILNWCEEHPVKTRQSEFLKMFPNARIDENGVVTICPICADTNFNCVSMSCPKCREEYWLAEVEENDA